MRCACLQLKVGYFREVVGYLVYYVSWIDDPKYRYLVIGLVAGVVGGIIILVLIIVYVRRRRRRRQKRRKPVSVANIYTGRPIFIIIIIFLHK